MVQFATSKELRLQAGRIIKQVQDGERFIVTYRGKPVALMLPFSPETMQEMVPREYEEAWSDIENRINETEAEYSSWDEAISESRRQG
ncbi:MAG: type II toxin-antitoxin system prevent-host-death family antitoxin [Bacillota bacterium]|nr:type II toxin-antitoxin system prevent-host-death family antitoxin [Bacillota bacterium]